MNEQAFNDLKAKSREAGRADKDAGLVLAPMRSERLKPLIDRLTYKQKQRMLEEYATGFRGYRLDVSKLQGMFSDKSYGGLE